MIEAILSLPDGPDKTARIAVRTQSCQWPDDEPPADEVEAWALQWP
jgi:hypothetical protein